MIYLCNCAECGKAILGNKTIPTDSAECVEVSKMRAKGLVLGGRIKDRPYCTRCLTSAQGQGGPLTRRNRPGDEMCGLMENSLRIREA